MNIHEAIIEVYAKNIQAHQISDFIDNNNPEEIAVKREEFLLWMYRCLDEGLMFLSQMDAWNVYINESGLTIEFEDEDSSPLRWEDDLKQSFDSKFNPSNYDENMGQQ